MGLLPLVLLAAACGGSTPATPTTNPNSTRTATPVVVPTTTPIPHISVRAAVPGIGTPVPDEGANHVEEGTRVSYATTPPTSGSHWPAWAPCGAYSNQVHDEVIVHNLEHGNVVISHNLTDPDELSRLVQLTDSLVDFDKWGVLRPYSDIDKGFVGMSAWTVVDLFQGMDVERIRRFYDTYRDNQLSNETAQLEGGIPC